MKQFQENAVLLVRPHISPHIRLCGVLAKLVLNACLLLGDLARRCSAGPSGAALRRSNFGKMSGWSHAVRSVGAEGLHFHDLRHTGNTFAAAGGAGIKDLMARMGHDSERAAMIYQHRARGADKIITSHIDAHVEAERRKPDDDDGAAGAPVPVS
jgi:Phage integrase family